LLKFSAVNQCNIQVKWCTSPSLGASFFLIEHF
jgi:hypothetical protein